MFVYSLQTKTRDMGERGIIKEAGFWGEHQVTGFFCVKKSLDKDLDITRRLLNFH